MDRPMTSASFPTKSDQNQNKYRHHGSKSLDGDQISTDLRQILSENCLQ